MRINFFLKLLHNVTISYNIVMLPTLLAEDFFYHVAFISLSFHGCLYRYCFLFSPGKKSVAVKTAMKRLGSRSRVNGTITIYYNIVQIFSTLTDSFTYRFPCKRASQEGRLSVFPCSPQNFLVFPCFLKVVFRIWCSLFPKVSGRQSETDSFCSRVNSFIFLLFPCCL